jgi:L-ascorbate metabolism protein UlaG (beta-lactamase superfamily)
MRRLVVLLLFAAGALAQPSASDQKMRDAQRAFAAGDCDRARAVLREIIAADPKNYTAQLLTANCMLRENDYTGAIVAFHNALELRPDAPPALLGLVQAYAQSRDTAHRDMEIAHLLALIGAGKIPKTIQFVREEFNTGDRRVIVRESPYVTLYRTRYAFDVFDPRQKLAQRLALVSRDSDQTTAGARRFSLISSPLTPDAQEATLRVYDRGEPAYAQVIADVKKLLAGKKPAGDYALAAIPAVVQAIPVTINDPSDPRLVVEPNHVVIEYIAHSCFRIHTPGGARLLIDPFASRVWLGYDFPSKLAADEVLITHPHYDHDADTLIGHQPPPWAADVRALRDPGSYKLADVAITGIRGKHADPWGKEFGQTNTIWLLETGGLRIAHLGDNGPLTDENLQALGHVDILIMPIDAKYHILKEPEIQAIRNALNPRIVIPMHYRLPDLEPSPASPEGLGDITPWLATQHNVIELDSNLATFSAGALLPAQTIVVFQHSPKVSR